LGPQKAAYSKKKHKNRAYLFHNLIIGITENKMKRILQTASRRAANNGQTSPAAVGPGREAG
jgi:hypothetical protein